MEYAYTRVLLSACVVCVCVCIIRSNDGHRQFPESVCKRMVVLHVSDSKMDVRMTCTRRDRTQDYNEYFTLSLIKIRHSEDVTRLLQRLHGAICSYSVHFCTSYAYSCKAVNPPPCRCRRWNPPASRCRCWNPPPVPRRKSYQTRSADSSE